MKNIKLNVNMSGECSYFILKGKRINLNKRWCKNATKSTQQLPMMGGTGICWPKEDMICWKGKKVKSAFFKVTFMYIYYMATHSSILDWKIPRTEAPCGLQSTGHSIGHH